MIAGPSEAVDPLRGAAIQVVGAGEAGGPALLALARAGVGALYVDDALDVAPEDAAAWIYPAAAAGVPRAFAAAGALEGAGARVLPFATGSAVTAALICSESPGEAREHAARLLRLGVPHAVVLTAGEGGEVVVIPRGAPCLECASRPAPAGVLRPGVAAALGTLAAHALLQALRTPEAARGRRLALSRGVVQAHVTTRRPGCTCGQVPPVD